MSDVCDGLVSDKGGTVAVIIVPAGPDDLTSTWLTTGLRASGALGPDDQVRQVSCEEIGSDRGFTGRVFRLTYVLADGGPEEVSHTVIVKLPLVPRSASIAKDREVETPDASLNRTVKSGREVSFYQAVSDRSSLPLPVCFYADVDLEARRVVLLLEDLFAHRLGDALLDCTASQAQRVVTALAQIHALWWKSSPPPAFLTPWPDDYDAAQRRLTTDIGQLPRWIVQRLPSEIHQLLNFLGAGAYRHALARLSEAPKTLIHRDLHLDNLFFSDVHHNERSVVIADWQTATFGPAVVDLAMFLSQSLVEGSPADTEEQAVATWLAELERSGIGGYEPNRFALDYACALIRTLAGVVTWLAHEKWERVSGRERDLAEAALGNGRLVTALMANRTDTAMEQLMTDGT